MSTVTTKPNLPPQSNMTYVPPTARTRQIRALIERGKLYFVLLMLMLPTLLGMIWLDYYPKLSAVRYSFYTWDGSMVEEFRGFKNYVDAFRADPLFWQTFGLIGILLVANLLKMWPSIIAAIVLHRLRSAKAQYLYRVAFVITMVIPGLVWLLIWKSFFDPTVGLLNTFLSRTGLMKVLQHLDEVMPKVAELFATPRANVIDPLFVSVWGMGLTGVMFASLPKGIASIKNAVIWWLILLAASMLIWSPLAPLLHENGTWNGMAHLVVTVGVVIGIAEILRRKTILAPEITFWAGSAMVLLACAIIMLTMVWTEPTHAFENGQPAWLGHTMLVIPAILFWGFPWIGTVGVLIYLAGLQNISQDVYEAADLDGLGPFGRLIYIELPLMMTQIRINLIFMTIGTLTDYGFFLILLGPEGGPGNKGMTPGLYMYREAFFNQKYGYACALGMVLFVIVLGITIFYQKYVKVEK